MKLKQQKAPKQSTEGEPEGTVREHRRAVGQFSVARTPEEEDDDMASLMTRMRRMRRKEMEKIVEEIMFEMFPIMIKTAGQRCHNTQET